MRQNDDFRAFRMIFYGGGGDYYHTVDEDGLRRPAVRTKLKEVVQETEGAITRWEVEIDWKLLKAWIKEGK